MKLGTLTISIVVGLCIAACAVGNASPRESKQAGGETLKTRIGELTFTHDFR